MTIINEQAFAVDLKVSFPAFDHLETVWFTGDL
jgi:hypothetical protein